MPFTPSHAVVALAFTRTPLAPAAIAVGAMAPDLPLFVRVIVPGYDITHDLAWLPVTVLLALALLLLWRCVLRPATRALVPRWWAARLPSGWDAGARAAFRETFARRGEPARPSAGGVGLLILALALGVLTHVVWDTFTHEGRWGVAVMPVLGEPWGPVSGITWLQHTSSVLGLLVLGVWALRWCAERRPSATVRRAAPLLRWGWWVALPVLLLGAWIGGLAAFGPLTADFTVAHLAYRVLPVACAVWAGLTIVVALVATWGTAARHARDAASFDETANPA
ncbi:DUF4184 family protein [Microbacterium sp. P04]|uniref:DUF4184 family protein n=1 Tax=Microbacterium sp. P04 TaxID=3366947 RepID=UPI0037457F46